jgi:hypothetical protein
MRHGERVAGRRAAAGGECAAGGREPRRRRRPNGQTSDGAVKLAENGPYLSVSAPPLPLPGPV